MRNITLITEITNNSLTQVSGVYTKRGFDVVVSDNIAILRKDGNDIIVEIEKDIIAITRVYFEGGEIVKNDFKSHDNRHNAFYNACTISSLIRELYVGDINA